MDSSGTDDGAATQHAATSLAEPVRQRLVQVASDVLTGLPADQVPPPLRPIAKFAAHKRPQLGAAALSATLDADADFRERVADVVTNALPQLVAALRAGEPTPASDPIDTAVVAYLIRPSGWTDRIAQINTALERGRAGRDAAADEIARVRAELADTRSQLKALRAEAAAAAAGADSDASEEATRLRNTLRVRTGELKAARAEAETAQAEAAALRDQLAGAAAAMGTELARMRARVDELENALEAARRDVRAARAGEDARLRVLLDTLTGAAAGLRRELALPAGVLRPADAVAAESAAQDPGSSGTGAVRDAADLDRLLGVPEVHLIIDGYNVTKTGYPDLPLADQRSRLVSAMGALRARSGAEVTVTFDGATRLPAQPPAPRGVRVLFSAPDETADDLIRRLVAAEPPGRVLVVVTSDQAVVADMRRAGAWTAPSQVLLDRLARG